ncbi:MAG: hypothetical protein KDD60_02035 [Bdellovibrionales bacterium]|nr:hypothetical protein [Bdellovibrionales bacterium]
MKPILDESCVYPDWVKRSAFFTLTLVVLYGMFLRVGDQATRDFWLDEVWRVTNIVEHASYKEIPDPIHYSEFLMGKLGLKFFGRTELAFRIWPLLSSLAAVIVFASLAWSVFSPPIAILIAFTFAFNFGAIANAHEFKLYSFEGCIFLASLVVAYAVERGKLAWQWLMAWLSLVAAGALNLFPFLCFLIPWLMVQQYRAGKSWRTVVVAALVPAGLFLLFYLPYSKLLIAHGETGFWKSYYLTSSENILTARTVSIPSVMWWYVFSWYDFRQLSPLVSLYLLLCALVVGPILLWKKSPVFALMVILPAVTMMVLSSLGLYPFMTRVSSFYYPMILFGLASVLQRGYEIFEQKHKWIPPLSVAFATMVVGAGITLYGRGGNPGRMQHIQESRALLLSLEKLGTEGDILFHNDVAARMIKYYGLANSDRFTQREVLTPRVPSKEFLREQITFMQKSAHAHRIWIFVVHRDQGYPLLLELLQEGDVSLFHNERRSGSFLVGIRNSVNSTS